jgi:hypothetical protein
MKESFKVKNRMDSLRIWHWSIGFNGLANGYVDVLGTPKASEITSSGLQQLKLPLFFFSE